MAEQQDELLNKGDFHKQESEAEAKEIPVEKGVGKPGVYIAIGLSGLCALGAEVVWTRLLSLMLGPTVYTFSIILAMFLAGLGIGSSVGAFFTRTVRSARVALGVCQLSIAGAVAWGAFMITKSIPYWPINPIEITKNLGPWHLFLLDLVRAATAVLPAAVAAARQTNQAAGAVPRWGRRAPAPWAALTMQPRHGARAPSDRIRRG